MGQRPAPTRRREARKRALDLLYQADLRGQPIAVVLAEHMAPDAPEPLSEFTVALVRGVNRTIDQIDALISRHAREWKLSRMPLVDRNLMRMALYEVLHDPDVPTAVAIDEAVELAKQLSTEDSGRFINGVLSAIANSEPVPEAPAPTA